jgi:hypothetical protein
MAVIANAVKQSVGLMKGFLKSVIASETKQSV